MVDPMLADRPPTDESLAHRARAAATSAREAYALIETLTGHELSGRILEIGCYDGAMAFRLAQRPGTHVVASDLARYYVVQRPGDPSEDKLAAQQAVLARIRERTRDLAGAAPGSVEFVEDDITNSSLAAGGFDAIVSFEVLEHLRNPAAAFRAMYRLLKPGGLAYHDYNPFLSYIGGHSLCTLDFPWGHARLDRSDFERYLNALRPQEATQALRFYDENLNRMTLADLYAAIDETGFETLAVMPWLDRALALQMSANALAEVQRTYATATATDLLASFAAVVVRRPA
jgi:SAM-dependent methyltransferase